MHGNSSKSEPSRRGFLRSLVGDLLPNSPVNVEEQREKQSRASILALKYGKNEANLTKIGIKAPIVAGDGLYRVEVSGKDAVGENTTIRLEININSGTAQLLAPPTPDPEETPTS